MTPAAERHLILEQRLIRGRAIGGLSADDEAALLEELGDIWWSMTDQECDAANERAARHVRPGSGAVVFLACEAEFSPVSVSTVVGTNHREVPRMIATIGALAAGFCVVLGTAMRSAAAVRASGGVVATVVNSGPHTPWPTQTGDGRAR